MICNFYSRLKKKPFSRQFVRKIIAKSAKELKIKENFELTVLLVKDKEIKVLNKKFRNKNKVTDVLAFSQKEGKALVLPPGQRIYLGDVIICYPQLLRQAKKFKQAPSKEFALLLSHGFLHLLGFKDENEAGYRKMKKLQEKILAVIYD